jgi:hypothetical protein
MQRRREENELRREEEIIEKERWRLEGRRKEEVEEGKRRRDVFVYSDDRDFSILIWRFLPTVLPIVD